MTLTKVVVAIWLTAVLLLASLPLYAGDEDIKPAPKPKANLAQAAAKEDLPPPQTEELPAPENATASTPAPAPAEPAPEPSIGADEEQELAELQKEDAPAAAAKNTDPLAETEISEEYAEPYAKDDGLYIPEPGEEVAPLPPRDYETNYMQGDVAAIDAPLPSAEKPGFNLSAGVAMKNYVSSLIPSWSKGVELGAGLRALKLGPVSLFANIQWALNYVPVVGVATAVTTNGVTTIVPPGQQMTDQTMRLGSSLEFNLGHRIYFIGGIYHVLGKHKFKDEPIIQSQKSFIDVNEWRAGVGAEIVVYRIPHADLGVRGYAEKDYFSIVLNLSLEPAPRKRASFNYDDASSEL